MTESKDVLIFAGGGGGDALAALLVADALGLADRAAFATLVWERTLFDPQPGPRAPEDFATIEPVGALNHRITADSRLAGDAMTFIPRLAEAFGVSYFLMDVTRGARRVQAQIDALQAQLGFDTVLVVDVGGDILARGDEPTLRSPLADCLALAGTHGVNADVRVAVTGFGLDGELTDDDLNAVYDDLVHGNRSATSTPLDAETARRYASAFEWLPSEVSGLTVAAALGHRGVAEIRNGGLRVRLTDESCTLRTFDHADVLARNAIASAFTDTTSLEEGEAILESFGLTSEVDVERESRAALRQSVARRTADPDLDTLEADLLDYSRRVQSDGVRYLSVRRIAKVLELQRDELDVFRDHLAQRHPDRFQPPLWTCSAPAPSETPTEPSSVVVTGA